MTITIAIDCMGGDYGPRVTVPAALAALRQHPDLSVILVGLEDQLRPLLASDEGGRIVVRHASEVVGMDESPALA
ncbi:MAG TPA: phosphate acyltransferase, partial [Azospira sp.]|nr:phosphate acyltransferase [Azospira sp.]